MRGITIAFSLGAILVHGLAPGTHLSLAHSAIVCWPFGLLLLVLVLVSTRRSKTGNWRSLWLSCLGFCCGAGWACVAGEAALERRLSVALDQTDVAVSGVVVGLPQFQQRRVRFVLAIDSLAADDAVRLPELRRIRLTWYPRTKRDVALASTLLPGQFWRLRVRLRAPYGFQNPGGFDYEAWLLQQGLDATGHVVSASAVAASGKRSLWSSTRLAVRRAYQAGKPQRWGTSLALVTADTQYVPQHLWQLFRNTGTLHLMVISGLHIGLMAAICFFLGRWLVCVFPGLLQVLPAQRWGLVAALVGAFSYAGLAQFSIPSRRALVMVGLGLLAYNLGRKVALSSLFVYALGLLLLLNPLAPLATGFWLSFGAVAMLLLYYGPRSSAGTPVITKPLCQSGLNWLGSLAAVQLLLFVTMAPLMWLNLGTLPWLAPVANLIAVPVISIVVVPLSLLGTGLLFISHSIGSGILEIAAAIVQILVSLLERMAALGLRSYRHGLGLVSVVALTLTSVLYLLPLSPWRKASVAAVLCWLFMETLPGGSAGVPAPGEVRLTVLDVGQGLSVLLDTTNHRLLYDTGDRFPSGFDLGSAVVVPAVQTTGAARLNTLILSHNDRDHVGGTTAVLSALAVDRILMGESGFATTDPVVPTYACSETPPWSWDGVRFAVLHPTHTAIAGNDSSCVVQIETTRSRLLLTGDISARVEQKLSASVGKLTVLLVPHHGSRSSSSRIFLAASRPDIALVSSGYGNSFGHPDRTVVARYHALGTRLFNTAVSGALVWRSALPHEVVQWRWQQNPDFRTSYFANERPYWRAGERLSMNRAGIKQNTKTMATSRNESRKAWEIP